MSLAVHHAHRAVRAKSDLHVVRGPPSRFARGGDRAVLGWIGQPAAMPRCGRSSGCTPKMRQVSSKAIPCWCGNRAPTSLRARCAAPPAAFVLGGSAVMSCWVPNMRTGRRRRPVSRRPGHGAPRRRPCAGCGTPRRSAAPAEGGLHRREHARPVFRVDECLPAPGPFGEVAGRSCGSTPKIRQLSSRERPDSPRSPGPVAEMRDALRFFEPLLALAQAAQAMRLVSAAPMRWPISSNSRLSSGVHVRGREHWCTPKR